MKRNNMKTKTFEAEVAVSHDEKGLDYVQVLPDNPRIGLVKPFRGLGYGQLLNNGTFDFTRKKRKKTHPVLKMVHSSLSFGKDGFDRFYFQLPCSERKRFAKLFKDDANMLYEFLSQFLKES